MAVREIRTTIALDGEKKFKNALASLSREMRVLDSELEAVAAAYDVNGDRAEYLANRQGILKDQMRQQGVIVSALEGQLQKLKNTENASAAEIQGLEIQLYKANARADKLKRAFAETDRELEELGRDSVKVGRQIDDGIGDGAEAANADLRELYDTMSRDLGSIRASTAITAVKSLWDTASGAFSAVSGFVDGTVEYRRSLSFLEQNAKTAGFDFSTVKQQLIEVQTLTGDAQSGVETISNLLAADLDEKQMANAVDLLAGAVIKFPDTLKFEALADGLQETLATGAATGAFAELLERLGVDVEEFNTALEESPTAAGDADIALGYLAAAGLKDVYESYSKANDSMLDARKTNAELEAELAEFGGTLEQYITTPVKKKFVEAMQWVNDKIAEFENTAEEKGMKEAVVEHITTPAVEAATADAVKEAERAAAQGEAIKAFFAEFSIGGVATGMANWLHRGFASTTEAEELALLAERAAAEPNGVKYYDTGLPLPTPEETTQAVTDLFDTAKTATKDNTPALLAEWETTGSESMDAFAKATKPGMEDASNGMYDAGLKAASSYHSAIRSQVSNAYSAGAMLAAAARQGMQGGAYMPAGPINKNFIASLNLDGREFARVFAPYMDAELQVNTR